jgi:hypothetical protein
LSRLALLIGAGVLLSGVLLWQGVKRLPWMGPLVADSLRAIVGIEAVATLEETVAAAEDTLKLAASSGTPRDYREAVAVANIRPAELTETPAFVPAPLKPMNPKLAAPSDGQWAPIIAPNQPDGRSRMYLTMLHPDGRRRYAELFIVAMSLQDVDVYPVAGTREPVATKLAGAGLIPALHRDRLLGAFNGGFKTVHGGYGMAVDGKILVSPQGHACTFARTVDGRLRIGTWERPGFSKENYTWWRQTPPCLYEDGHMHKGLLWDDTRPWGAAIKGDTVTRRSAVGLSKDGTVLYVGISNSTTARALASGMHHAGAHHVAQLDINWSYPKFAIFEQDEAGDYEAQGLVEGFLVKPDNYVKSPETRDFFYVVRK